MKSLVGMFAQKIMFNREEEQAFSLKCGCPGNDTYPNVSIAEEAREKWERKERTHVRLGPFEWRLKTKEELYG